MPNWGDSDGEYAERGYREADFWKSPKAAAHIAKLERENERLTFLVQQAGAICNYGVPDTDVGRAWRRAIEEADRRFPGKV